VPSAPHRKLAPEQPSPALSEAPAAAVNIPEKQPPVLSTLSAEEIYRLIQEAAYFKAEARQFASGVELQDWLEAENEVKQRLQVS
jgi:hypothetical protein